MDPSGCPLVAICGARRSARSQTCNRARAGMEPTRFRDRVCPTTGSCDWPALTRFVATAYRLLAAVSRPTDPGGLGLRGRARRGEHSAVQQVVGGRRQAIERPHAFVG
jgi:hypothetical protein